METRHAFADSVFADGANDSVSAPSRSPGGIRSRRSSALDDSDASTVDEHEQAQEAGQIYVMMEGSFRVSRNTRVQWFLQYLNKVISFSTEKKIGDTVNGNPLEIIASVPRRTYFPLDQVGAVSPHGITRLRITPNTTITFLSKTYRFVFALDLTPSMASVSLSNRCIAFDEILLALSDCLRAMCMPSVLPGTNTNFSPKIFVTVLVHVPILLNKSAPVIVKGFHLRQDSAAELMKIIRTELSQLEKEIVPALNAEYQLYASQSSGGSWKPKPFVTLDMTLANILRKSLLSVQLLPENSSGHIVIITDGIVDFPDIVVMDSLLSQLRSHTISVSFVRVGRTGALLGAISSGFGYVFNVDLMEFVAKTTTGSYLEYSQPISGELPDSSVEAFHKAFFTWTFQEATTERRHPYLLSSNGWQSFDGESRTLTHCLSKTMINASVGGLLSVRLREGFTIKDIVISKGETLIDIVLVLPWKPEINLEYHISGQWPPTEGSHVTAIVFLDAPYEFHFDLNRYESDPRLIHKNVWGPYRAATLKRFKFMINSLEQTDNLLVHFEQFRNRPAHYSLPEIVRDGMPLFYLPPDDMENPVFSSDDLIEHAEFAEFWRPLCTMDVNLWHKWLHVHRISILLEHDKPLPSMIFHERKGTSVRASVASNALHDLLRQWMTIVLVDYHSYVRFILDDGDTLGIPRSFFIIRMAARPPCVVLRLAFLGGTSGTVRLAIINELNEKISALRMPTKASPKADSSAVNCCWRFAKPVEKMLIQYKDSPGDILPTSLSSPATHERSTQTQPPVANPAVFQALCRFLYCRRYRWMPMRGCFSALKYEALSRVLTVLARRRLSEGFQFASTSGGIFNLLLEIEMKDPHANSDPQADPTDFPPCVAQYIIFPPSDVRSSRSSRAQSETVVKDQKYALAVEIWLEPQYGVAVQKPKYPHLEGLTYREMSDKIHELDEDLLSTFLTFETLMSICTSDNKRGTWTPNQLCKTHSNRSLSTQCSTSDLSGDILSFPFNLLPLLARCQKTLLKFSSFQKSQVASNFETSTDLLLGYFTKEMGKLHTKEVILNSRECSAVVEFLKSNKVTGPCVKTAPTTPVNGTHFSWDCVDGADVPDSSMKLDGTGNGLHSDWRCFVKILPDDSFIITLIPSSFASLECFVEEVDFSATQNLQSPQKERQRLGSPTFSPVALVIPVYIFNCTFASLETIFLENGLPQRYIEYDFTHQYYVQSDRSGKRVSECRSEEMGIHRNLVRSSSLQMRERQSTKLWPLFSAFEEMYAKAFVQGVYRSLHLGFEMDPFDVQLATDAFCAENPIEMDLTSFMQTLYPEFVPGSRKKRCVESLTESSVGDTRHSIKSEFQNIISSCLKQITTKTDLFYFAPPGFCDSSSSLGSGRQSNGSEASVEFRVDGGESSSERTGRPSDGYFDMDPDSISVKSNGSMASVFGSSEITHSGNIDDGLEEDDEFFSPLFVQFVCTVMSSRSKKILGSCTVQEFPTTIDELTTFLDHPSRPVDWSDVSVRFDILCLSLPDELKVIEVCECVKQPRTISGSSSGRDIQGSDSEFSILNDSLNISASVDEFRHLPLEQSDTIRTMVDSLKWHLRDEVAYLMSISSTRPTEQNLQMVVDHVLSSRSRLTCSYQPVKLRFVYNEDHSFALFKERFVGSEISGYHFAREGAYYYLVPCSEASPQSRRRVVGLFSNVEDRGRTRSPSLNYDDVTSGSKNDSKFSRRSSLPVFTIRESHGIISANNNEDIRAFNRLPSIRDCKTNEEDLCIFQDESGKQSESPTKDEEMRKNCSEEEEMSSSDENITGASLPGFWIILGLTTNEAQVYFHVHEHEPAAAVMSKYKKLVEDIVKRIEAVSKLVNQEFLLRDLSATQRCDNLLEPETSEELWKGNAVPASLDGETRNSGEEEEQSNSSYLEASRHYAPGYFSCDMVYEHEFVVHPRLKTGPGRPSTSRAVQALLTILRTFSVSNRTQMFVIQDNRAELTKLHHGFRKPAILYVRLSERVRRSTGSQASTEDALDGSPRTPALTENDKSSEMIPLDTLHRVVTFEDAVFTDTAPSQAKKTDMITLSFFGLDPVSTEISDDLMNALQNRLDEAVLESLHTSLFRNPMLKLGVEDIRFIQPLLSDPTERLFISFPEVMKNNPVAGNAAFHYLLQNLGVFLHGPKYTEAEPDKRFIYYNDETSTWMPAADELSFLYNRAPDSGGKGIAFVYVSLSPIFEQKSDPVTEFQGITCKEFTEVSEKQDSSVEFLIWERGDVNVGYFKTRLRTAVHHALLDFWLEQCVLPSLKTNPIDIVAAQSDALVNCLNMNVTEKVPAHSLSLFTAPNLRCVESIVDNVLVIAANIGFFMEYSCRIICVDEEETVGEKCAKLMNQRSAREVIHPLMAALKPGNSVRLRILGTCADQFENIGGRPRSVSVENPVETKQKSQKRFLPRFDHKGHLTASRERLFLLDIDDTACRFHLYNFAPDTVGSFSGMIGRLFDWQHERFRFLNNVLMQKCGVFLPMKCLNSKQTTDQASFKLYPMQVEHLIQPLLSTKDKENLKHRYSYGSTSFDHLMENSFPHRFFANPAHVSNDDVVFCNGKQFTEIWIKKKHINNARNQLNKLYDAWLLRDRRPVNEELIKCLKSNARPAHFCASPLLFDPVWRKNLGMRFPDRQLLSSTVVQQVDEIPHGTRSRHGSGVPTPQKEKLKPHQIMDSNRKPSNGVDNQWHVQLRNLLMQHYVHYLQMQGFSVVLSRPATPQRHVRKSPQSTTRPPSGASSPTPAGGSSSMATVVIPQFTPAYTYLQRCVSGGIIFIELFYSEPFYFFRMYVVDKNKFSDDYSSVGNDPDKALLNLQREIDRLKVAVHMHSFLYDFHLRRVSKYIIGEQQFFKTGYQLISFFEDFANYYQKAPSYSKSSFQSGLLTVPCGSVPAQQMYRYILAKNKQYQITSLPMDNSSDDQSMLPAIACNNLTLEEDEGNFECRFILWLDTHDIPSVQPAGGMFELPLRYYIVLTSKDEFYSTEFIEERFGSFKTLPPPNRPRPSVLQSNPIVGEVKPQEGSTENSSDNLTAKASLVAAFPNFLYIGYFSRLETELYRIVQAQRIVLEGFVNEIVRTANSDYVRDTLWSKLTSVTSEDDGGRRRNREESGTAVSRALSDGYRTAPRLSAAEFEDLVSHVYQAPVVDWDDRAPTFFQAGRDWIEGLFETLKIKYLDTYRWFSTNSGIKNQPVYHLVIVSQQLPDIALYLTFKTVEVLAQAVVLSRNPINVEDLRGNRIFCEFLEGFINACCFHMWKMTLSS